MHRPGGVSLIPTMISPHVSWAGTQRCSSVNLGQVFAHRFDRRAWSPPLLGAGRAAAATRRAIAPSLNGSAAVTGGTAALLILLLIWWSPGRAFQTWASSLIIIALVVVAVVALRRVIMTEHPDLRFADHWASVRPGRSDDTASAESVDAGIAAHDD